jgi:flagellar basal body-associated protein FliL
MIESVSEEKLSPPVMGEKVSPSLRDEGDTFSVIWNGENHTYKKKDLIFDDKVKKKMNIFIPISVFFIVFIVGLILIFYQAFTSSPLAFANFIISPNFPWFLATIGVLILFAPMGIYGIFHFYSWMQNEFFKVRGGYMKIRRKMGNDRWNIFWKKPIGNKISAKTEDGINIEVPVKLQKDYMGWEGNIPFIELDENLAQMPLTRTILQIPQEHATRMSYLAYLAGKISALKESQNLQLLLIIAIVIICAIGGLNTYMSYTLKESVDKLNAKTAQIGTNIGQISNSTNPTPPKVD